MVPPFASRPARSRPIETADPGNAEHQFGEKKNAIQANGIPGQLKLLIQGTPNTSSAKEKKRHSGEWRSRASHLISFL